MGTQQNKKIQELEEEISKLKKLLGNIQYKVYGIKSTLKILNRCYYNGYKLSGEATSNAIALVCTSAKKINKKLDKIL